MVNRRFAATLGIIALVLAACTGGGDDRRSRPHLSRPHLSPPRRNRLPGATAPSASRGTTTRKSAGHFATSPTSRRHSTRSAPTYISADAGSSEEQQATDVENLLSQGANVIIILAQNTETILPSVQAAVDQGVPVIGYDRLIESANALYVSFDNVTVGRMQAEAVLEEVSEGTS